MRLQRLSESQEAPKRRGGARGAQAAQYLNAQQQANPVIGRADNTSEGLGLVETTTTGFEISKPAVVVPYWISCRLAACYCYATLGSCTPLRVCEA